MNNQGYREIFNFNAESLKILNDTLRALWKKVMGHVELKDLSDSTRKVIDSKATSSGVASAISQAAGEIRTEVASTVSRLQSQIDQTPEKIELAVKEVQVGGANYLLSSGTPVSNAKYNIANYKFSDDFKPQAGETYTVRIWGSIASDRTSLGVYNTNGYIRLGAVSDNGDGTYSLTFKWRNDATGYPEYNVESPRQIQLYQAPRDATGVSTITRIKLEAGNKATDWTQHPEEFRAGTNVVINEDEFKVRTPEFSVDIPAEDGDETMMRIDKNGVYTPSLESPNVAQRYDGPTTLYVNSAATSTQIGAGTHFRSLANAVATLNNKWTVSAITINIAAGHEESGTITIRGIHGGEWINIYGSSSSHALLQGRINLHYCAVPIRVRYIDIVSTGIGIQLGGRMTMAQISNCVFTGPGTGTSGTYGIDVVNGAHARVSSVEIYDFYRSFYGQLGGIVTADACAGNCTVGANRSTLYLTGKMPCASTTWGVSTYAGEVLTGGVSVDQGSKPTTPTVTTTTVSYSATNSDVYAGGGWNNYSNNDIYQGYTDALGEHRGCFWFDNSTIRSALKGKTIKQATLKLYQVSGSGRNQPVQVNLEGIAKNYGESGVPYGNPEYGVIGTTLGVGKATTFTIPTAVITNLVAGTINGLMLRTGETASMKGDDNSYHYARFAGYDSGNRPVLTVTYA